LVLGVNEEDRSIDPEEIKAQMRAAVERVRRNFRRAAIETGESDSEPRDKPETAPVSQESEVAKKNAK
jgi:hypothetical protein